MDAEQQERYTAAVQVGNQEKDEARTLTPTLTTASETEEAPNHNATDPSEINSAENKVQHMLVFVGDNDTLKRRVFKTTDTT